MTSITVKSDLKQMARGLSTLQRNVVPSAIPVALNNSVRQLRARAIRKWSSTSGIQQKKLRKRFTLPRSQRATRFRYRAGGLAAAQFVRAADLARKVSQQATGAQAGAHHFAGAFVATMPTGHKGIFRRTGKTGSRGSKHRRQRRPDGQSTELPIKEVLVDRTDEIMRIIRDELQEQRIRWDGHFARALTSQLKRRGLL